MSPEKKSDLPWPVNSVEWSETVRSLGLSAQQAKIVELVILGKKDKQIGALLELKRSTIRTHLRRIFKHLQVTDRMELALRLFTAVCERCVRKQKTRHHPKG